MIKLTTNIEEAEFITHAGNFHADDVFSTVLMERLFDNITLIRLNDYQDDGTKIAYDIGLGKFDHHGALYDKKKSKWHPLLWLWVTLARIWIKILT